MKTKPKAETGVVRSILDELEKHETLVGWRCQSGQVKVKGGWMHLAPAGTPDVIGYFRRPGAPMFGIETKASHGDACNCDSCKAQRDWRDLFRAAGGTYVFARTAEQALAGLGLR